MYPIKKSGIRLALTGLLAMILVGCADTYYGYGSYGSDAYVVSGAGSVDDGYLFTTYSYPYYQPYYYYSYYPYPYSYYHYSYPHYNSYYYASTYRYPRYHYHR